MNRITIFKETMNIIAARQYETNGKTVCLRLVPAEYEKALYFSEPDVNALINEDEVKEKYQPGDCRISLEDMDSFEAAMLGHFQDQNVLVLNFANPVTPGGGVRYGAAAQEEDLCRRSTLLKSLESSEAAQFYEHHRRDCDCLSSHAAILSPYVEVYRDGDNRLLGKTKIVSVLTCAAPMTDGYMNHPITELEYQRLIYQRIQGIFGIARANHYRNLILGAWGCGVFSNDAFFIAGVFAKVLEQYGDYFDNIVFAVPKDKGTYNFECFQRYFQQKENQSEQRGREKLDLLRVRIRK